MAYKKSLKLWLMIIYLDESGDLGFDFVNKKPSKKFVITLLVCNNKSSVLSFKQACKRTLKNKLNHRKNNKRSVDELHATSLSYPIKQYFYKQIKNMDWQIYTVVLNKECVYDNLAKGVGRKKLYNFLSKFLLDKVDLSSAKSPVTLIVDKCKNKEEIEDFNQYLANQFEARLPLNIPFNIYHEDSKSDSGLQAVDLFCWGIYRKYEYNDQQWYGHYADKIYFETEYFGKQ
jgi:hypothetical protein